METQVLSLLSLTLLLTCSLKAEGDSGTDEIGLLRQEIQKQEIVLQGLREKLEILERSLESTFQIAVAADGIESGGEIISLERLENELKDLPKDTKVVIRAASSLPFKKVASVMELCLKADLESVSIATTDAE